MIAIVLAAAALFADATPAAAQTAPAAPPAQAAPAAQPAKGMVVSKKTNDYVCHTEQVINTRITKKVCRSKAESDQERAETQQAVERMQNMTPGAAGH